MKAIPYSWTLHENVLIGDPAEENPHLAGGLSYIPGGVLRGALIETFQKTDKDKKDEQTFYDLFFSGKITFLNAYPSILKSQQRALPSPLALHQKKDSEKIVYNLALMSPQDAQLKTLGTHYFWMDFNDPTTTSCLGYEPLRDIRLHNMRPPDTKNDEEAQLFTYDALASGQVLRGWIISEEERLLDQIKKIFKETNPLSLDIGKSRSAEYGHVSLKFGDDDQTMIVNDWQEVRSVGSQKSPLVVTLLSDCIIRDPSNGSFATNLQPILRIKHDQAFCRMKVIGGYNRTWNMPLPQSRAISAGSVFVYAYQKELDDTLQQMVTNGIGERTIDGFGRIALNCCQQEQYNFETRKVEQVVLILSQDTSSPPAITSNNELQAVAQRIYLQRARQRLKVVLQYINYRRMPSNTQLGRLSAVLEQQHTLLEEALQQGGNQNYDEIQRFLTDLTKDTREKYQKGRVEETSFLEWLQAKVKADNHFLEFLNVKWNAFQSSFDPREYEKLLTVEYLIAFLHMVQKERKKEKKGLEKEVAA